MYRHTAVPGLAARKLWLAAGLCILAVAASEDACEAHGGECASGQPTEDEEHAEAEAASTLLLQQAAKHSRAPVSRGVGVGRLPGDGKDDVALEPPMLASRKAMLQLGRRQAFAGMLSSPTYAQVLADIAANVGLPASDPYWQKAMDTLKEIAEAEPAAANYMRICQSGNLTKYLETGCAPDAEGSIVVNGSQADAYFCGNPGIDWSKAKYPVNSICTAKPGTAYEPDGQCGRVGTKGLVVNFARTVPHWKDDIYNVNVPSLDCILGLGNCDIYYCQHCPGRC